MSYGDKKMANKVYIRTDGVKGFFERAHETARKLDKKEPIAAETVITFEDASAMWRCLTPQRTRLIKFVKKGKGTPIAHLGRTTQASSPRS